MEEIKKRKEEKIEHKQASKVIFISCVVLTFLLALGFLTSLALLLFPVKRIEVVGDSRYAYSEIIEVSGIKNGMRLYYVNGNKAENRILSSMPYLQNVPMLHQKLLLFYHILPPTPSYREPKLFSLHQA